MIKITNFSKSYGTKVAVKNLNFEVKKGEITGFIGHNGAGKSTTLKAIVGILPFQEGEITICNKSIVKDPIEAKKLIAYVPDNPDIYEFMTGMEYLNFVCDAYAMSQGEREKQIKAHSEEFEITSPLKDLISTYSHGTKQKLVLLSAFVHNPTILILDEPFVGLDPKASSILKLKMKELCQLGGCILYSTHVLEVAEQLCDNIVMLKKGKMVFQGKTQEILEDKSLETLYLEEENEDSP